MSNWKTTPLTFYNNKITCDETGSAFFDAEVMMDWEDPIMSASSAYITEGGGDILEVGFGMGISANYIQSHNISSHTIIENHPQVIEKAIEWSKDKSLPMESFINMNLGQKQGQELCLVQLSQLVHISQLLTPFGQSFGALGSL